MNAAYTLGRILVPLVFIVAGIQKADERREIAKMLADNNVPIPDEIVPYLGSMPKYRGAGLSDRRDRDHLRADGLGRPEGALGRARC